jgi:hypothetical protein
VAFVSHHTGNPQRLGGAGSNSDADDWPSRRDGILPMRRPDEGSSGRADAFGTKFPASEGRGALEHPEAAASGAGNIRATRGAYRGCVR